MKCTTVSGPYRCDSEVNANGKHEGICETTAPGGAERGPAGDSARASQALRARLDAASGDGLDLLGKQLGVNRWDVEPDVSIRERIWSVR